MSDLHTERTEPNSLLDVREVAQLLHLSPNSIYHMTDRIPGVVRLSRRCLRFHRQTVLDWLGSLAIDQQGQPVSAEQSRGAR